MRLFFVMLASLLVAACGEGFSGTYKDAAGMQTYSFKNNGKVTISQMGIENTLSFKKDGKTLRLSEDGGGATIVLTIQDDNTITGLNGILNIKKVKD